MLLKKVEETDYIASEYLRGTSLDELKWDGSTHTTYTTYSSTKNTIRCDYSEVAELTSTLGNIEVTRHDTYQQFKCSKSKGTYDINGGHV